MYKSLSDEEGVGSPTHDGHHIYQSVDLKPGQTHELVIKNNDPHSILTWDFDVVRADLKFTVFRTPNSLPIATGACHYFVCKDSQKYYSKLIHLCILLFDFLDKTHSILESEGFELDKDYYRVEPTLDCHQKESVQV